MAARGFRKRSLSSSGAAAAFVVGSLTMTAGARFGVTLIAFFLSSSKLTRLGAQHKRRVEERFKEGGQRDGWQVLSNSIAATTVALLFLLLVLSPGSFPARSLPSSSPRYRYAPFVSVALLDSIYCRPSSPLHPLKQEASPPHHHSAGTLSLSLFVFPELHLAPPPLPNPLARSPPALSPLCSTHLPQPPRSLLPFPPCTPLSLPALPFPSPFHALFFNRPNQQVPRGTNGGVSLMGLGAAAAGGAFMGAVFLTSGLLCSPLPPPPPIRPTSKCLGARTGECL
ncbi:unnamed protein product [Closterium sp. NIES-64]|nr:unnamed protein product [Closterium sp. NIES-64]